MGKELAGLAVVVGLLAAPWAAGAEIPGVDANDFYEVTYAVGDSSRTVANIRVIGTQSIGSREFLVIAPGGLSNATRGFVDLSSVRTILKPREIQKRAADQ